MQIGLSNLRRLQDFGPFEIRPLTLLVGRNSSGKSTFLRSFPLIRQSLITRTSSPLLWFGDLVDFGDFDEAVYKHDTSLTMNFNFLATQVVKSGINIWGDEVYRQFGDDDQSNVRLNIQIGKDGSGTRIKEFLLQDEMDQCEYRAVLEEGNKVTSLKIDGVEMISYLQGHDLRVSPDSLLPSLFTVRQAPDASVASRPSSGLIGVFEARNALANLLIPDLDKRTTVETSRRLVNSLLRARSGLWEKISASAMTEKNISWKKLFRNLAAKNNAKSAQVRRLVLLARFSSTLEATIEQLGETFSNTLYIGPARARSDRYYRYQDLNVSEIDPDGKNLPMFLNSLKPDQLSMFSAWVEQLFGYGVDILRSSGHISINLKYQSGSVNVVDTGYGVSQILPVLGQIWWANARPVIRSYTSDESKKPHQIIAIEQPELHLHPAHQALLADTFISALRDAKTSTLSFVVETHSETLVNRVGSLIAEGAIDAKDVQIIVFDDENSESSVTSTLAIDYSSDGHLINWPYGFFLPFVA